MRYLLIALAAGVLMGSAGVAAACGFTTASKDQIYATQSSDQAPSGPMSQPAKDSRS